jgi:hypothetical protein
MEINKAGNKRLIFENFSNTMGIIFCQVIRINIGEYLIKVTTERYQAWKGIIPIFIITPSKIKA